MPAAIKAFNVSATANLTLYTCPANRVAKVLIGSAHFLNASAARSLNIGGLPVLSTAGGTIVELRFNCPDTGLAAVVGPPLEAYLSAGQALSVAIAGSSVHASILVIEEVAS